MKKKIVIKVPIDCDKCRSKALKIAAGAPGVSSVKLEGKDRDRVVVTGNKVDVVCLTRALQKKFRHATIESMADVKERREENEEKRKVAEELTSYHYSQFPHCTMYHVCDDSYASNCTIM